MSVRLSFLFLLFIGIYQGAQGGPGGPGTNGERGKRVSWFYFYDYNSAVQSMLLL